MSGIRNRRGKEEEEEDPVPKTFHDAPEAEGSGEDPTPPPRNANGPGPAGQRQQERVTLVFDRSATHIPENAREQVGDVWVFNPNKVTVQFKLLTTHPDAVFLFPKNQTLGPRSAMIIKVILTDRDIIEKLPAHEQSKVLVEWRVLAREKRGLHEGAVSTAVFRFAFDVLTTPEREGEEALRTKRWNDRGLPSPLTDMGLEYKGKKKEVEDCDDEFEEKEARLGLLREGLNTEMKQVGRRMDALKRELAVETKRYKELNYILNDRADLVDDPGISWFNTLLLVTVFSALALTSIRLFLA